MTGAQPDRVSLQRSALLALKQARARIETLERAASEPLAIIGVACRFPGAASTPEAYWQLLRSGTNAITEVPADRWDINRLYDPDPEAPGKMTTRWGGFLDQVDQFDPRFFGISPREAVSMDPQQRLVLEVGWEAVERAGLAAEALAGSRTGVFLGASTYDYSLLALKAPGALDRSDLYRVTGSATNIIAGRLSYTLGLRGPSMVVDTACSSTLVAVHLAGHSLRTGECDLALAGGVSLMLAPDLSVMFSKAHMLSPDGRCKTFDAAADGFVRGEGCGVIVLRRLSDALAHGDPILALLRGSAINQDGRSGGLTAPNGQAQQAVIRQALVNARVAPAEVGYVEAHGTGTALGDPIEVGALAAVLGDGRAATDPVHIGAAKTNIGHLEAAAGIAGLIKTVLTLQHREIPPNLHLRQPNPHIPWDSLPVSLPTSLMPWRSGDQPRVAGVSSFGFSGTNAHVILAEAPTPEVAAAPSRPLHLLCLSARDQAALRELAGSYQRQLTGNPSVSLADLTHTAHTGRSHFDHRAALTAGTVAELSERLAALATAPAGEDEPEGVRIAAATGAGAAGDPPVAFLFTGQGAQYPGMCRRLYETLPVFRTALQRCDELLREHLDRPLLSILYPEPGEPSPLDDTTYTQPALFAIEYALAQVWRSWGIVPSAVVGHSVGEYVAACEAGVLSLEDGLALVAGRARLMGDLPPGGAMAAILAPEAEVAAAIAPHAQAVAIAAVNGPANTVISGTAGAVDEISAGFRARGTRVERLTVSHAFHSPLLDPMLDDLEKLAGLVRFAEPRIELVSNLTGQPFPPGATFDAAYLRRHAREPVRFHDGMSSLHRLGYRLFVEIGPRPVLLGMGRRCLPEDAGEWLPSVRKNRDDWQSMLDSLGSLYLHGRAVDWAGFDRDFPSRRVILPTYPFQRQRYWHEQAPEEAGDPGAVSSWLYRTQWRPQPTTGPEPPPRQLAGHWTILADRGGVGRTLADLLEARGASCELVFDGTWQPDRDALPATLPTSRGVIHLWGLDTTRPEADPITSLQHDQARQCGSVREVVRALAGAELPEPPRLWIVTRGAQPVRPQGEDVAVAQAPLWGLGRVIALEHPQVWGGLIDLDPETTETAAGDATRLLGEVCAGSTEDQVAWRAGRRHVARLTRAADLPAPTGPPPLHADATYAITGGLGALGSVVAAWLARQGARHIVLIGRGAAADGPPADAPAQAGIEVRTIRADVTEPDQLAGALAQIEATMPPLRGIVHAAGVLDDGLLLGQDWPRFQRVLAPKVQGAWNLHALTRSLPLDFFVLFSSAASLLGSPGQANYAAANAFLDALAHHRQAHGLPALTVNWGPWEVGMAASTGKATRQRWAGTGLDPLAPAQGTAALAAVLGGPAAQVAVLRVDWARLAAAFGDDTAGDDASGGPRALLGELIAPPARTQGSAAGPSAAPAGPPRRLAQLRELPPDQRTGFLRDTLRRYAGRVLGMAPDEVPLTTSMLELGMDSLMVVEVARLIKKDFQLTLYPRELYEHPTIGELATYLDTELAAAVPARAAEPARPAPLAHPGMVFLLSGPRSGSTLLRVMLAGHPQLFCPPELHLLPFDTLTHQRRELDQSYLHEGLQRALMELDGGDAATSKALLERWTEADLPVHEVYDRLMRMAAPRLLVDKSPTYAGDLDTLRRAEALFPTAKYLCLVRHPYATIESFARMRMHRLIGAGDADPFQVAEQVWLRTNQNMLDLLKQVDADRQHLVRYEDLVRRPEETIAEVCAFLGIPTDPAVLRPYDGQRMTDGVHGQSLAIGDPNFLEHDRIDPDLADAWRSVRLPRPLGAAARKLAARFSYPLPEVDGAAAEKPTPATEVASRELTVSANGLPLSVTAWGDDDRPAIVFLHGILDHGMAWEEVAVALAAHGYQVIAPDQRGHGRSGHAATGTYQLLNYVADLDALLGSNSGLAGRIAALDRPFLLVGHSMGAAVAATYASLRPDRVGGLVLVEGLMPGEPTDDDFAPLLESRLRHLAATPAHATLPDTAAAAERLRQATPSLSAERAYRMAQRLTRPCPDGVRWCWDPALLTRADLSYDTLSVTATRYRSLLARITAPVTLIHGDGGSPDLARLRAAIPRAVSEVVPGGHNLHLDAPAELAAAIARSATGAGIHPEWTRSGKDPA